jgi:hypothetical protein
VATAVLCVILMVNVAVPGVPEPPLLEPPLPLLEPPLPEPPLLEPPLPLLEPPLPEEMPPLPEFEPPLPDALPPVPEPVLPPVPVDELLAAQASASTEAVKTRVRGTRGLRGRIERMDLLLPR